MRTIAHLDLDCFFVSCERIKDPSLNGKPVVVGGNPAGRGVVSTASYEARKFGVHSAMPTVRAKQLCPGAVFLRPDFDMYSMLSDDVEQFLKKVSPVVEQASIDEFYLDLTGCDRLYPNLLEFGTSVKRYLKDRLKLPATVGIATNKLVSKIAVAQAKPDGLIHIRPGEEADFLAPLPVREMPGIGKATARQMAELGFETLGQIACAREQVLERHFGSWGLQFKMAALGVDTSPVVPFSEPKSIGRETTFSKDAEDRDYLLSMLSSFAEECAMELRRYRLQARTVTVKFRLPDFKTFERSKTIRETDQESDIYKVAEAIFRANAAARMKFRLVGLSTSKFVSSDRSGELFEVEERRGRDELAKQVDRIRSRYGLEAIQLGSSLFHGEKPQ